MADADDRRYELGVLFVCMGNICRSPTAEGVFRKLVSDQNLHDRVLVDSAGVCPGQAPPDGGLDLPSAVRFRLAPTGSILT